MEQVASDVVKLLLIDQFFPDIDMNLIILAIGNDSNPPPNRIIFNLNHRWGQQFKRNSFQRLEYLGDRILKTIILEYLRNKDELFTINSAQTFSAKVESNKALTVVSWESTLCKMISEYVDIPVEHHNICGNTIEQLLGALYFQYGSARMKDISSWFLNIPIVSKIFNLALEDVKKYKNTMDEYLTEVYTRPKIKYNYSMGTPEYFEILFSKNKVIIPKSVQSVYIFTIKTLLRSQKMEWNIIEDHIPGQYPQYGYIVIHDGVGWPLTVNEDARAFEDRMEENQEIALNELYQLGAFVFE